jgi:transcriptional regulator with XRE-family HTH domain
MVEVPRGPATAKFGPWLKAERELRGVSRDFMANALGVSIEGLDRMEAGRVQMPNPQRRRAEGALAKGEVAKRADIVPLRRKAS